MAPNGLNAMRQPQASLVLSWAARGLPPSRGSVGGPRGEALPEQTQSLALRAIWLFAALFRPQASGA